MPKQFFTERDIEDMVARGVLSMVVDDNVVLTELAYEKAVRLGMKLVRDRPDTPPSAPVRPFITQISAPVSNGRAAAGESSPAPAAGEGDLQQRIRSAVLARLGSQVDPTLLDAIIKRVLNSTGLK